MELHAEFYVGMPGWVWLIKQRGISPDTAVIALRLVETRSRARLVMGDGHGKYGKYAFLCYDAVVDLNH